MPRKTSTSPTPDDDLTIEITYGAIPAPHTDTPAWFEGRTLFQRAMRDRNISIATTAKALGVSQSTVSRYIRGKPCPDDLMEILLAIPHSETEIKGGKPRTTPRPYVDVSAITPDLFRAARKVLGLTQAQIGTKIGITQQKDVSRLERGDKIITRSMAMAVMLLLVDRRPSRREYSGVFEEIKRVLGLV